MDLASYISQFSQAKEKSSPMHAPNWGHAELCYQMVSEVLKRPSPGKAGCLYPWWKFHIIYTQPCSWQPASQKVVGGASKEVR